MKDTTTRWRTLLAAALLATLTAAPACASDQAARRSAEPAAAGKRLVWAEEFEALDRASWSFETGGHGWGNHELQYYTDGGNAFVQYDAMAGSRVLVIEARRGAPAGADCWYGACQYSSSRLVTRGKREFQYGRIEARMRLPQTQGVWPAFWMLGGNFATAGWPRSGEIDIMEHVGFEPTLTHGALHGPGYSGDATPFTGTHDLGHRVDTGYHVYAVEWDADGIAWFVDGVRFHAVTRAQVEARGAWVFDQPFFLLLNVAVGGGWPGNPDASSQFPQRLYVDWVRVHQDDGRRRGKGSQPLAPAGGASTQSVPGKGRAQTGSRAVPDRRAPAAERGREARR